MLQTLGEDLNEFKHIRVDLKDAAKPLWKVKLTPEQE